ncbi:enoyl-CoA hydratase-related protein [Elizabethkingia ursingii]|uniref:enoyl-CoA hydratase-related protein n=1 Tax=Elizabethkingia ursingii TaxID=1756150 RepID=UPI0020119EB1|nr:enoyl-CoA hydratase-related protein [Elizabethkingia ursingii]MCL1668080.1 enoyl-CoA hydratase-related protein [Elizabethkingia ursingii]
MDFETLIYTQDGYTGILTINRPQALNALNVDVLKELKVFTDYIKTNTDIRTLIITGAGDKAFVAGADIKAMQGMTPEEAEEFSATAQAVFNAIEALPFAVIAAVNGFALGGGCELALACDIILASEKARFGLPEVTLGLLPCFGGTQRLPRAIGLYKAKEMIFSGEFYTAESCKEFGFVNRVIAPEKLLDEACKLAATIASRGPSAVAKAKHSLNTGVEIHITDGLKQEAYLFGELFDTEDHNEGIGAFVEKRTPDFKGK